MDLRFPAIAFLVLGIVFLVFTRRLAVLFIWLDKKVWDEEARRRFPHLAPVGPTAPRSAVLAMGACWIVVAIILWFMSQR